MFWNISVSIFSLRSQCPNWHCWHALCSMWNMWQVVSKFISIRNFSVSFLGWRFDQQPKILDISPCLISRGDVIKLLECNVDKKDYFFLLHVISNHSCIKIELCVQGSLIFYSISLKKQISKHNLYEIPICIFPTKFLSSNSFEQV